MQPCKAAADQTLQQFMGIWTIWYDGDKSRPLFKIICLDPPTFDMSKSQHICLSTQSCQSHRLAFIIERKIKFLTMFSLLPNPFHFFIGRMAKSIKIHTKVFSATLPIPCSQISVSRRRAPAPLKIQTKAPLLPGGGGRREGRLETSIFWATSLGLTCFLPQRKWT